MVDKMDPATINLANLAGVTVVGSTVFLTEFSQDALSVGSVTIPPLKRQNSATTQIRSLQQKNRLMLVSMDGPFTTPVRDTIKMMGTLLEANDCTAAFLPATTRTDDPGRKYFGFEGAAQLRNVNEYTHNVRLLGDGNGMLFTQGGTVKYLPLHCVPEHNWTDHAIAVHKAPGDIKFLGRVEGTRVPVTLASGESYFLQVQRDTATPEPMLTDTFTKVFGTVGNTPYLAALKGDQLVFARQ